MSKIAAGKSKRGHIGIMLSIIGVIAVAVIIEIIILNSLTRKDSNKTSLVILNQVSGIIKDNEENEEDLIESLKEEYIIRAQTVAYILQAKPEAETNVDELIKIAILMSIDEIHIFDETGTIYAGTLPQYYGFSFDSGEQMAFFKPMLSNRLLTMCQDVTPNTAEGKSMMYAITWNEAQDKMIQVGIKPVRLLEELHHDEISTVIASMPTYEGIDIIVADTETGVIEGATDSKTVGLTLSDIGISKVTSILDKTVSDTMHIDGVKYNCKLMNIGDYIVIVSYSTESAVKNISVAIIIELIYLALAGLTIICVVARLLRANSEINTQMATLASISDIYNSMHLLDLENNTAKEYNARDEVSRAASNTDRADEIMNQMTTLAVEDSYMDEALKFTDVTTLADRMQDKKIISSIFISKAIGWFRASFITIEKDWSGRPKKVLFVTQNINKEKKKEEELIFKSNVDELTGLYNRRAYEEHIAEHKDTVTEENFVFVSLDVNGLKRVNDSLGHAAGDELIKGAANCLKQCFAPYGRIYRVGGDEFSAMIFANENQLEKIKSDFEEVTAKWSGNIVKSLSISSGYVSKRDVSTTSVHEMSKIADKKMYEAKEEHYRIYGK
jgi:diguanylate cyclase (GGDEF)-like protein